MAQGPAAKRGVSDLLGRQDLHVHTDMSDGDLTLQQVVEKAAERSVTVGIADHVSMRNVDQFIASEAELRRYLKALEDFPVFRSGEFCWCDVLVNGLPDELVACFDYRVGSNHGFQLPDGTMASPWWRTLPARWDQQPEAVMEHMVDNLCDLVRTMPVQIVAHSTLLPPALLSLESDVHAWWTAEREDRYVEALAGSGVALEISNRYRLPHDRLLRKAKQAGARFSLGSDGHTAEQVARLDWATDAARRAGVTDSDLFVPARNVRAA